LVGRGLTSCRRYHQAPLWPLPPEAAEAADWVVYTSPKPFAGDDQAVASFARIYGGVSLLQGQTLGQARAARAAAAGAAASGEDASKDDGEGEEQQEGPMEPVLVYSQYPQEVRVCMYVCVCVYMCVCVECDFCITERLC
jgi:hypothetical protein